MTNAGKRGTNKRQPSVVRRESPWDWLRDIETQILLHGKSFCPTISYLAIEVLSRNHIFAFTDDPGDIGAWEKTGLPLATSQGHPVNSYLELLHKIAALQYHNPRFQILFRGQSKDYRLKRTGKPGAHSSLYPSILRAASDQVKDTSVLLERFKRLKKAEDSLKDKLRVRDIHQNQIVRWAILQHYEVCETPLLDVTPSIQTALTFAIGDGGSGFLYAFAFPQLTGVVSVSVESMTQVIDLCRVCPPNARRPHFQYGMLAGDYPAYSSVEETHGRQGMIGNNFACRLISKFSIDATNDWSTEGYTPVSQNVLFPDDVDDWHEATQEVKAELNAS
ncbi:MAG: FRG domain-containing protein [Planctomycetaceae bacterium]|nr:FRG domain-containing protein [Planctomycetaceae bacterium]